MKYLAHCAYYVTIGHRGHFNEVSYLFYECFICLIAVVLCLRKFLAVCETVTLDFALVPRRDGDGLTYRFAVTVSARTSISDMKKIIVVLPPCEHGHEMRGSFLRRI